MEPSGAVLNGPAWTLTLQAPYGDLIESHAVALICRALNIGRVTAFVGSGASMAYGRISWNDMIYSVQANAIRRFNDKKAELEKQEAAQARAQRIYNLLKKHEIARDAWADASQQLTIFQLAEELHRELDQALKNTRSTFREDIMWLTHDDRGHVEQILLDAVLDTDYDTFAKQSAAGTDAQSAEFLISEVQSVLWGKGDRYDR